MEPVVALSSALGFKDREYDVQEMTSLPGRLLVSWMAILPAPLFYVENKREVR